MNSEDYPRDDIVNDLPRCGSLGGKDINELPPDTLNVYLNVKQANQLKLTLGNLVGSCLAGRAKERQAGVDAIHLINTAIADTVQFITPHRTVADAYDDAEEIEEMLPDPDLPLDIKVAKLPEDPEVGCPVEYDEPDYLINNQKWLVERLKRLDCEGGIATNFIHGTFGTLEWVDGPHQEVHDIVMFLNGKELYWQDMAIKQFADLLNGLGVSYKEGF